MNTTPTASLVHMIVARVDLRSYKGMMTSNIFTGYKKHNWATTMLAFVCQKGPRIHCASRGGKKSMMMMMIMFSFYLEPSELRSDMRSMPTQVEALYVATEDKFRPKFV